MKIYGYCRISTPKQNIERQVRNILKEYPDALREITSQITTVYASELARWLSILKEGDDKRNRKGESKLKRNGLPMLAPSNSYLVKPSIYTERNKGAVENVIIIIKVIEQAGNTGVPPIKASTIVERNEVLKLRLSRDRNKKRLLERVFKRTWELLREQTTLLEVYKGIELPDSEDIRNIPTMSNLNKLVFSFPHKGKQT